MLAIHSEGLTRDFKDRRAVDSLSLEIRRGTIFGLLGPTGSGKSTVVRLLLGLLTPTAGSATILGRDPYREGEAVRSQCGVALEAPGLYTRLNAEQNLDFIGRVWRFGAQERARRTQELLTHFGLWERRHEKVAQLSHGMQQRLALARALFPRPALLFLDQPTAGLDPTLAQSMRRELAHLAAEEDVTVFLTTENLAEAEQLCDELGLMREGRLVAQGEPAALRSQGRGVQLEIVGSGFSEAIISLVSRRREVLCVRPERGRLWVELAADGGAAPVVNLLVESGAEVEEVVRHQPDLQTVYRSVLEAA